MKIKLPSVCITVTTDLVTDQRAQRIALALADAGYKTTLVGRYKLHTKPFFLNNVTLHWLRLNWQKGIWFYVFYNLALLIYLVRKQPDIINSCDADSLLACTIYSRLFNRKLVFDAHEYFSEVPEVINRPFVQKVWRLIERFCIPKAHAAYTVGSCLASTFEKLYNLPFQVVRNVPSAVILSPNIEVHNLALPFALPEGRFILYQGAVNLGRGIEQLLAALEDTNYVLVICGDGDMLNTLKRQYAHRVSSKHLYWLGNVQPYLLRQITERAYIGVNLLIPTSESYRLSLANKFFDYVAASKPQICSALPEYVHHNKIHEVCLLVPNLSTSTLLNALTILYTDNYLYDKLANNAILAQSDWNWDNESKVLIEIYNGVMPL